MPDFGDVLRQAMELQEQLLAARDDASHQTVTGSAGGGVVRITMTGTGDVTDVSIQPDAVDPSDLALLEDLVLVAFRDARDQVRRLEESAMGAIAGMPGLGDLAGFGGAGDPAALFGLGGGGGHGGAAPIDVEAHDEPPDEDE
jgi:DNA-binding YbaB/EbfC family protein